jgi:hypothetical protein
MDKFIKMTQDSQTNIINLSNVSSIHFKKIVPSEGQVEILYGDHFNKWFRINIYGRRIFNYVQRELISFLGSKKIFTFDVNFIIDEYCIKYIEKFNNNSNSIEKILEKENADSLCDEFVLSNVDRNSYYLTRSKLKNYYKEGKIIEFYESLETNIEEYKVMVLKKCN